MLHRPNNLPAVVLVGDEPYYYPATRGILYHKHGKFHRVGGHAGYDANMNPVWYLKGKQYSEKEYEKEMKDMEGGAAMIKPAHRQ